MILVKDGRVIDPARGIDDVLDLVIDGKIAKIGKYQRSGGLRAHHQDEGLRGGSGAGGRAHVHFRDPASRTRRTSAAPRRPAGGFTSVVCMANTKPSVDNVETLGYVLERGRAAASAC